MFCRGIKMSIEEDIVINENPEETLTKYSVAKNNYFIHSGGLQKNKNIEFMASFRYFFLSCAVIITDTVFSGFIDFHYPPHDVFSGKSFNKRLLDFIQLQIYLIIIHCFSHGGS